jgi:hypothetical protein
MVRLAGLTDSFVLAFVLGIFGDLQKGMRNLCSITVPQSSEASHVGRREGIEWVGLVFAVALTVISVLIGFYGFPGLGVEENAERAKVVFVQARQAFIAALASLLVCVGLLSKYTVISWFGAMILVVFSAVFFFGIGALYLPLALLLVVLLAFIGKRRAS